MIEKLKKIPKIFWILTFIVLVGLFLRTYHFRDWLYFYPDQARDLVLVRDVLSGQEAVPLLGPIAASSPFRLGPMYYYFQITAGWLFGVRPDTMAYPDLFFGVLSIPLLFYFLRRYFVIHLSLLLTGLYSVSFFAIRYARFAWNTNPIPFFSLLFLLALLEFMVAGKKTKWFWAGALGIAVGVGVQLHTVLLLLMPATLFSIFGYLFWKRALGWSRLIVVVALILFLNIGQLMSETQTGFHNARYFWHTLTDRSPRGGNGFLKNAGLDIVCHAQATTHLLSSLDNKDYCDTIGDLSDPDLLPASATWGSIAFGLFFMMAALYAGWFLARRASDVHRVQFLALIALYCTLLFLVIFPVMDDNAPMRYFLPTLFVPLIALGLILQYLALCFPAKGKYIASVVTLIFVVTNLVSVAREGVAYAQGTQSRSNYVVLGELEQMRDFILSQSVGQSEIFFMGRQKFYQNYGKPMDFVFEEKGVIITKVRGNTEMVPGRPLFYLADDGEELLASDVLGHPVEKKKRIGQVAVFLLQNK